MSTITVRPDAIIEKDTNEQRVIEFDWDADNLATSATITTSTWTITVVRPATEFPIALANDNNSIVPTANRKTQTRLTGGTLGSLYHVTNQIVTNETPTQTKERSIYVQVIDQ
jgi:hypothetical protein